MRCLPHRHLSDRMTCATEYKLYIFSLGTSRQPSLTYYALRPNTVLNTVFCNTHISFSSLNMTVQVLHLNDRHIYTSLFFFIFSIPLCQVDIIY